MAGRLSGFGTPAGVRLRHGRGAGLVLAALLLCAFGLVGPAALRASGATGHGPHGVHAVKAVGAAPAGQSTPSRPDTAPAVPAATAATGIVAVDVVAPTSSRISSRPATDSPRPRGPPSDAA